MNPTSHPSLHPLRQPLAHMGKLTICQTLSTSVLLFLLFLLLIKEIPAATAGFVPVDLAKFQPFNCAGVAGGSPRRALAPFQLCLQCRCCAVNDPSNCSLMPCCFAIDCDLPNKPYGVCAFVPKSCNCTSCA